MDKLFGFWETSDFPYLKGKEIESIQKGKMRVKGYPGFLFKPFRIVDFEYGQKIYDELYDLTGDYQEAKENLHAEFMERRKKIIDSI